MSSYPGMYPLRAQNEKFKQSVYGKKVTPTKEQAEGCPTGPAYLLMIQDYIPVDSGWPDAEGGGSYRQNIWTQLWTYDVKAWEAAILSIERSNRNPNRYGKSTVYLAYKVQSIAQVEMTIRIT